MTEDKLNEMLSKLIADYCRRRGYDANRLDLLTEEEYKELLADTQIDAYLKRVQDGRLVK